MPEIVFYQIPISHFCEKVRWALDYKGLPYRSVCVNPITRRELARISAGGQVPIITDGERVVCDSTAIVEYLEEICPEPPLIPPKEPERREAMDLEQIADEEIGPAVRRVAYEALFSDPRRFARLMLPKKGMTRLLNPMRRLAIPMLVRRHFGITEERLETDRRELRDLLAELGERLGGRAYFVGDRLTIADISVASLLGPLDLIGDAPWIGEYSDLLNWMRDIRRQHGRRAWAA